MKNLEDQELIDLYLRDELNADGKMAVNRRLEADKPFRDQLEFTQQLILAFQIEHRQQLADLLGNEEKRYQKTSSSKTRFWLAAAASILLIAIAGLLVLQPWQPSIPQYSQLVDEHFKAYPNVIQHTTRGGEERQGTWAIAYALGEYERSADLLGDLSSQHPDSLELKFYLGVSFMGYGNYQAAVPVLEKSKKSSEWHAASLWYLSLAFLGNEEPEKATEAWKTLGALDVPPYSEKAMKLLEVHDAIGGDK